MMFGHDDSDKKDETVNPALPPQDSTMMTPAEPSTTVTPTNDDATTTEDSPAPAEEPKEEPKVEETSHYLTEDSSPTSTPSEPHATDLPAPAESAPLSPVATTSPDDLINIKRDALKQLSPLVDQLNQTPEEKFRTMMMMIQASDDDSLVKAAFAAANEIPDEKTRAQALLDIINEINYFTQQKSA